MPNKLISLLLAISMLACLSACGKNSANSSEENTKTESHSEGTAPGEENKTEINVDVDVENNTTASDNTGSTEKPESQSQPVDTSSKTNPSQVTSGNAIHTHSYSAATCTSPKKCSCGQTAGTALGHSYLSADCTTPKICSRCGAISGNALGHSYSAATCTSPKKCNRCGETSGNALGHNYVNNKCSRCGKTDPDSLPVDLSKLKIINISSEFWYSYNSGTITDSFGNSHSGYHRLTVNGLENLVIDYNLGSKYSKFSCDVVAPEDMLSDGKANIEFYVDDILKASKTEYIKTTGTVHIEFDVKNGQRLTVKLIKKAGALPAYGVDVLLVNAQLNK